MGVLLPPVAAAAAALLPLLPLPIAADAFLLPSTTHLMRPATTTTTTTTTALSAAAAAPSAPPPLSELQHAFQEGGPGLLLDLSAFGVLSVTGEDRLRFLHNQLTNSFTDARPGQALEASYTTALGRCVDLVTVLLVPGAGEEALVLASPGRGEAMAAAMNKYIFPLDRVRVAVKEVAGVYAFVGGEDVAKGLLSSSSSSSASSEEGAESLPKRGECKLLCGGGVLAWGGNGLALPGFTAVALEERGAQAWVEAAGAKGVRVGGMEEWEALRIAQGRPVPDKELTSDVTPLEAGLYHTVHLEKGCYLGQETIAKVANNKGERQRLYGLKFPASAFLTPGARLLDAEGKRAGAVTSVLPGEGRALAYVRRTVAAPVGAELRVERVDGGEGARVTVVELPYATRTEAESASGAKQAAKAVGVGVGEGGGEGADAAAAKKAEEERKAKKLEEMRKKLEAFQAKQKKAG